MENKKQRRHERIAVTMQARIGILIPENTFQPVEFDCTIHDISERGAMISIQLTSEIYTAMLQKTRYCRLTLNENGLPCKITGRAVWLQPKSRDADRTCRIGLFFEDCPLEIVNCLRQFVEKAKQQTASSTSPSP